MKIHIQVLLELDPNQDDTEWYTLANGSKGNRNLNCTCTLQFSNRMPKN